MDVTRILAELKAERKQIDEAIVAVERLIRSRAEGQRTSLDGLGIVPRRRGRPPGSKNKVQSAATEPHEQTGQSTALN